MNEDETWYEKMGDYLQENHEKMSHEERRNLEAKLAEDRDMNLDFRVYQIIEQDMRAEFGLKKSLQTAKEEYLKEISQQETEKNTDVGRIIGLPQDGRAETQLQRSKVISFKTIIAVAACVFITVAGIYLLFSQNDVIKLANSYIKDNYSELSPTMNAFQDSLQSGVVAYNQQDYSKALQNFERIIQADPSNNLAIKYSGLTYLQKKDYDKALQRFEQLANMKLYSNPADFLKALTLLQRNKPGDKEAAKIILQKVVNEKDEGWKEAETWLKNY